VGPTGCEFFYTYRPVEQPPATTQEELGNPV